MQLITEGALRILIPDKGYKLVNKNTGITANKIYLGIADDLDNYAEIMDEKYVPMDYVVDFAEHKDNVNESIDIIAEAMDEIFQMFGPFMPIALSETGNINPIARLYLLMIQRGLRQLDDVPEIFKQQIKDLL